MKKEWLALIVVILCVYSVIAAPAVCVIDGFVDNTDGHGVAGAFLSSNGRNSTSETGTSPEGYYLIGNLINPQLGRVDVLASIGSGKGSNFGITDFACNAHINLTVCYPPSKPILVSGLGSGHETSLELKWKSGSDERYSVYDEVNIDGNLTIIEAGRGGGEHVKLVSGRSWSIRTCNKPPRDGRAFQDINCCSDAIAGSYGMVNNPPSSPVGGGVSENGIVILNWTSGIDPEDDATYDQFRIKNLETGEYFSEFGDIENSAMPPKILEAQRIIWWEIRTCDVLGACSEWVVVVTSSCTLLNESCPDIEKIKEIINSQNIGGGIMSQLYCNGIKLKSDLIKKIDLRLSEKDKKISIYGLKFVKKDITYCPWCYDGVRDYDETGVDCGGSCPKCFEKPFRKIASWWWLLLIILAIIAIILLTRKKKEKHSSWRIQRFKKKMGLLKDSS